MFIFVKAWFRKPQHRQAAKRYMQAVCHKNGNEMRKIIIYFLFALIIISCRDKVPEETFIDFKPNKNVTDFKILKIVNDEYPNNLPDSLFTKNFDSKTDTIKYTEKEIYISYLAGLTGCVKYGGDIEIKKDSLVLKLVPINNVACTELNIARIVFRIKNPKKIKYKIAKAK